MQSANDQADAANIALLFDRFDHAGDTGMRTTHEHHDTLLGFDHQRLLRRRAGNFAGSVHSGADLRRQRSPRIVPQAVQEIDQARREHTVQGARMVRLLVRNYGLLDGAFFDAESVEGRQEDFRIGAGVEEDALGVKLDERAESPVGAKVEARGRVVVDDEENYGESRSHPRTIVENLLHWLRCLGHDGWKARCCFYASVTRLSAAAIRPPPPFNPNSTAPAALART